MYTFEQLALDIIRNLTDEQQKKEVMVSKDGVLSGATELRLGANDQPEIIESWLIVWHCAHSKQQCLG